MRKIVMTLGVVALACTMTFAAGNGQRGVGFMPIGFIDDPGPYPASNVFDMTDDGNMLIVSPTPFGAYCVFWTVADGWGQHIGGARSICRISGDGSAVMASTTNPDSGLTETAVWGGTLDTWDFIPLPNGFTTPGGSTGTSFFGMGGNADYATGLSYLDGYTYPLPFWWNAAADDTNYLYPDNMDDARGNDITGDGTQVVGWNRMLFGTWRGAEWVNGEFSFIDGQGYNNPLACVESGKHCTSNSADPVYGCPGEYVDDARCNEDAVDCVDGVCVGGGSNEGEACSGYWNCGGWCEGGGNDGEACTSDYYCPDTLVCADNPEWDKAAYKGEAYQITEDGQYTIGFTYGDSGNWQDPDYDWTLSASAWRRGPDGSFDQLAPPEGGLEGDSWTPIAISEDGSTVVGRYGWWIYSYPVIWTEETGTLDLQWFLVGQGLDELWFWYLQNGTTVSADGTKIGGSGYNPDNWLEGFIVDITKAKVCHYPSGDTSKARTLTINWDSLGDHLGHGDELATCEFVQSGARSRSLEMRPQRPDNQQTGPAADFNPAFLSEQDMTQQQNLVGTQAPATPSADQDGQVDLGGTDETPGFETFDNTASPAETKQPRAKAPRQARR